MGLSSVLPRIELLNHALKLYEFPLLELTEFMLLPQASLRGFYPLTHSLDFYLAKVCLRYLPLELLPLA